MQILMPLFSRGVWLNVPRPPENVPGVPVGAGQQFRGNIGRYWSGSSASAGDCWTLIDGFIAAGFLGMKPALSPYLKNARRRSCTFRRVSEEGYACSHVERNSIRSGRPTSCNKWRP